MVLPTALVEHARAPGLTQVEPFDASENGRAIVFYQRHGFARFGVAPRAVMMPEGPLDDLFLVRRLDG